MAASTQGSGLSSFIGGFQIKLELVRKQLGFSKINLKNGKAGR